MPFFMIVLQAIVAATPHQPCMAFDKDSFTRSISEVRTAREINVSIDALGRMGEQWENTCPQSRSKMDKATVRALASLLERRVNWFVVSSILLDAGPNRRLAQPWIREALKEETIAKEKRAHLNEGVLQNALWYALKCIDLKISTGQEYNRYCSYIRNSHSKQ